MASTALLGKTVLLTGASRGFGEAIARQLWDAGATLALLARDSKALEELAMSLPDPPDGAKQSVAIFPCDLGDFDAIDAGHAAVVHSLGPVDVLVNNAAIQGPLGPLETLDFREWKKVFEIDLFAAVRLCQLVIPEMKQRRWGKIVCISGGGATGPRPDVTAYACAKTALVRLAETLAEELDDWHIDVNAVAPGAMNTRMLEETLAAGPGGIRREYEAALKRKREASGVPPEKAAEAVLFLCSPESDRITGRLIAAIWDDWRSLPARRVELARSDVFTLRRIVAKDRGLDW